MVLKEIRCFLITFWVPPFPLTYQKSLDPIMLCRELSASIISLEITDSDLGGVV